jgi:hypothetical protein
MIGKKDWIPACAGMTKKRADMQVCPYDGWDEFVFNIGRLAPPRF